MLRVVVIEDEPLARQHLVSLLQAAPAVDVVAEAPNGRLGLEAISRTRPDAVFTDIEMPGLKGTDLMHLLPEPSPALVFTTAYAEHAVAAFAGGAIHYLLKPIEAQDLAVALKRLRPLEDVPQRVTIPVQRRDGVRLLKPSDVEALLAYQGDCVAWTADGRLPVEGCLQQWEARLSGCGFMRVHRSALVNLDAVLEVDRNEALVLATGSLPVSLRRMETVRKALGLGL